MRISDWSSDVCSSDLPQGSSFDAHCEPSDHRLLCLTFESKRAVELFECDEREFDLPPCHDVRSPRVRQALARLAEEIGRASCRERVCHTCRSRWSPYH